MVKTLISIVVSLALIVFVSVFELLYVDKSFEEFRAILCGLYEKVEDNKRIDVFDAAVFATIRFCIDTEKVTNAAAWFGGDDD